jgi:hypothetical protein
VGVLAAAERERGLQVGLDGGGDGGQSKDGVVDALLDPLALLRRGRGRARDGLG